MEHTIEYTMLGGSEQREMEQKQWRSHCRNDGEVTAETMSKSLHLKALPERVQRSDHGRELALELGRGPLEDIARAVGVGLDGTGSGKGGDDEVGILAGKAERRRGPGRAVQPRAELARGGRDRPREERRSGPHPGGDGELEHVRHCAIDAEHMAEMERVRGGSAKEARLREFAGSPW